MPGHSNYHDRAGARPTWSEAGRARWTGDWGDAAGAGWRGDGLPPRYPSRRARLWIPVVVSFLIQVAVVAAELGRDRAFGTPGALISFAFAAAGPIALIGARRFPGPVVALVALITTADVLIVPSVTAPFIALAFAIVLGMIRGARIWVYASVAIGWLAAVIGASMLGFLWPPPVIVGVTIFLLVTLAIGASGSGRRARFEEQRRRAVQRRVDAAQQERVRIARELHDVLAHSLSQINVQAGVGLHLIETKPELAAESLASIKATSKTALEEVRMVLGILRSDDPDSAGSPLSPEPDLARLPSLVSTMTSSELAVTLDNAITSVPAAPVQLALFRIVQESLTNVVRHAEARHARVELTETAADYVVTVTDDGIGASGDPADGRGLLGMRERAELLGGSLETSAPPDGGFQVRAVIPHLSTGQPR